MRSNKWETVERMLDLAQGNSGVGEGAFSAGEWRAMLQAASQVNDWQGSLKLFARLARRKVDFSTARKILFGMIITAIAAGFMAVAGFLSNNGEMKVSGMWLMGFYGIITVGELFLSPMALSLVTKLTPKRFVGLTMGGWFFATAVGNKFSGFLGVVQGAMSPSMFFLVIVAAAGAVAFYILSVLPRLDAAIKKYGA